MTVQLVRPTAGTPQAQAVRSPRVVYEPTDIEAWPQNTVNVGASAMVALRHPRIYSQPSAMWSIMNVGPGAISVRWDGVNTVFGAPEAILLPPGTGYAEAVSVRVCIAADGSGATVSVTSESFHG